MHPHDFLAYYFELLFEPELGIRGRKKERERERDKRGRWWEKAPSSDKERRQDWKKLCKIPSSHHGLILTYDVYTFLCYGFFFFFYFPLFFFFFFFSPPLSSSLHLVALSIIQKDIMER
ncbi:hypothetical protein LY78DRAFT_13390 [Colletotrichum sublineola]|nr:hypothetical protein LY78DRAFT_13390 [Colletotrichum sublineola]